MIIKLESSHSDIIHLLGLAASQPENEMEKYLMNNNRTLFLNYENDTLVGLIGVLAVEDELLEITHIAVAEGYRAKQIGSQMIAYLFKHLSFSRIVAETDKDAVGFCQKYGFVVQSLGEKYPNVERFYCEIIG